MLLGVEVPWEGGIPWGGVLGTPVIILSYHSLPFLRAM